MFIPSIRHPFNALRDNIGKDFNKKSEFNFFERRPSDLVMMTFENVPFDTNFRWDKEWWKKVGRYGINGDGHEFQIPSQNLVGVHLRDLNKKDRENIVEKK